jgi:hypothetical protein
MCPAHFSLSWLQILQHYHSDLRSVFLYYSQLEKTFTDYWPPSMTFAQWMLFCKVGGLHTTVCALWWLMLFSCTCLHKPAGLPQEGPA